MKISQIKKAHRNIEDGAWVNHLPDLPGVRLKVRGFYSTEAARQYAEAKLAMSDEDFQKDEVKDALDVRILSEAVLLDWDGIQDDTADPDEDGNYPPLPYDPEVGKMLLADPDMVLLRQAVRFAAQNVAQLGRDNLENAAKN